MFGFIYGIKDKYKKKYIIFIVEKLGNDYKGYRFLQIL